ncbi:MAG: hypothetical protein VW405_17730 [Rhodospirillaceae bacterium]
MSDHSKPQFLSLGLRDLDRPAANGDFGFMFAGEASAGRVSYHGRNAGTQKKKYAKTHLEGYLTYRAGDNLTLFGGLGYRFLHDDSGGHPTSNGGIAYDRQNHLGYAPFGFHIDPMKNLSFKIQANWVLRGWQMSQTEDTDPSYPNPNNIQDEGWGIDLSANYQMTEKWAAYTFVRYWRIDRSDADCDDVANVGYVCWWEPENVTKEIGIGVAYKF